MTDRLKSPVLPVHGCSADACDAADLRPHASDLLSEFLQRGYAETPGKLQWQANCAQAHELDALNKDQRDALARDIAVSAELLPGLVTRGPNAETLQELECERIVKA